MVDAVSAVAASSASIPTQVERSLSIASEPDNKWVAERQAQIDADLQALGGNHPIGRRSDEGSLDEDLPPLFEGHARRRRSAHSLHSEEEEGNAQAQLLSGESEEIGSTNFDERTPFGSRVAIV